MAILKIYTQKSKSNKKPGWQKEKAEYDAWMKSVSEQTFRSAPRMKPPSKVVSPVVSSPSIRAENSKALPSRCTTGGAGTVPVNTPERLYADDEEMLQRERKARERKFNSAPAYNKGTAQFVSEEELANTLRTNKRR